MLRKFQIINHKFQINSKFQNSKSKTPWIAISVIEISLFGVCAYNMELINIPPGLPRLPKNFFNQRPLAIGHLLKYKPHHQIQ